MISYLHYDLETLFVYQLFYLLKLIFNLGYAWENTESKSVT